MKKLVIAGIALIFSGCAATRAQKIVDSWIGKTEQSLVYQWGVPHSSQDMGDLKAYEYQFCSGGALTQNIQGYYITTNNVYCDRWNFFVRNGIIERATYNQR